jgi:tetratricopeptide (TPR) repeat protein
MKKPFVVVFAAFTLLLAGTASALFAAEPSCARQDTTCRELAKLFEAEQYDALIEKVGPNQSYSNEAKDYIGRAYLQMAGKESNTPEQEEQLCLKALEYGATQAYMGLYFIHAGADQTKALGYLKQYVATKPNDAVPFVLLGEAEFESRNYAAAKEYLLSAKEVARGRSSNMDWLLFQACYLAGDYPRAATMLDESFAHGKTIGDLKALIASDARFAELGKRPEFKRFSTMINGTNMYRISYRS